VLLTKSGKKLYYVHVTSEGNVKHQQKDPFGITVTEVSHMSYNMKDEHQMNIKNIKVVKKLFKEHNSKIV